MERCCRNPKISPALRRTRKENYTCSLSRSDTTAGFMPLRPNRDDELVLHQYRGGISYRDNATPVFWVGRPATFVPLMTEHITKNTRRGRAIRPIPTY